MNERINAFRKDAENYRQYVLAELRLARKRALLVVEDIDHIGKTLGADMIDCDTAMAWLADAKALEFLRPIVPNNPEANAKAADVFAKAEDGP